MIRRSDRMVVITAVAAVTLIPTAVFGAVKLGAASTDGSGDVGPTAPARTDPASLTLNMPSPSSSGKPTGGATPSGTNVPFGGGVGGGLPGLPSGAGDGGNGGGKKGKKDGSGGGDAAKDRVPANAPAIRSFTRKTDVTLAGEADGDYQRITETASFTLAPRFALTATGVRKVSENGKVTTTTEKVVVEGHTLRGFDGQSWTSSTLTDAQLEKLRTQSDPRQFTYLMYALPNTVFSGPDGEGLTRYRSEAKMSLLYALLPEAVVTRFSQAVPGKTGVALDLAADYRARPSSLALKADAAGGTFTGKMTFGSYH